MKLNLELLAETLRQKENELPVSEVYVNAYLLDHVLRPALDGADIAMTDIDYTAFDLEDVALLTDYYCNLEELCRKLSRMTGMIGSAAPVARSVRLYC